MKNLLTISLTQEQCDIIVGTMLGDAKLVFSRFTQASYVCEQSSKHQDYLYHLFSVFNTICVITEPVMRTFYDKRYNKTYTSYYFATSTLEVLGVFAEAFYVPKEKGGKLKIVPSNIAILLTPRALAYWIMDDGQYVARGGITLCTDGFTLDEVNLLAKVLKDKYDLNNTLHKKGNNHRIYIKANSLFTLRDIVGKYMQPSFIYKLDK